MKTIAVLTMFFLPAAAVAALFSMPFFEVTASGIRSKDFHVYWAVTIPLTIVVMGFWFVSMRIKNQKWPIFGRYGSAERKSNESGNGFQPESVKQSVTKRRRDIVPANLSIDQVD